jgi:hypothetical protein
LDQLVKLEYILFEGLEHHWLPFLSSLECAAIALESLPLSKADGRKITVALHFKKSWRTGYAVSKRVDEILAANDSVGKVEVIFGTPNDRQRISEEMVRLEAKRLLWVRPDDEPTPDVL